MLKYSIKLSDGSIKQNELVWMEKYLSLDLSFITGTTSQDYHLEKFNRIAVSNTYSHTPTTILPLETENVTRQGYVVVENKEYPIYSSTTYDYINEKEIDYNYIFLNGKYYYENDGKFIINDWLSATNETISAVTISADTIEDNVLKIDTVVWIENGIVTIDDNNYIYDFDGKGIKYTENGGILPFSSITKCDDITYHPYSSTSLYDYVTKFTLTKEDEINEPFENISFSKYYYYVSYKNEYLNIRKDGDNFYCDVPIGLLEGSDDISTSAFTVFYSEDLDEATSENSVPISGRTFDVLRNNTCYVIIDDNVYYINSDIINANDGSQIAIYFDNEYLDINVGDTLRITNSDTYEHSENVYHLEDDNSWFVVNNGKKEKVEANICDKASIDGVEFDITYNNDKKASADCLININDENVPMKIDSSLNKVERYGDVLSPSTSLSATIETTKYDIKTYSGVTIDGEKYIVKGTHDNMYIITNKPTEYLFTVTDVRGSSMVVCKPYLDSYDFSEEFIENISKTICEDVVLNKNNILIYSKNKIFGDKEITKDLVFRYTENPTSSDDYFNLFDNFTIYARSGYIHIPLSLQAPQGNNIMQDEVVNRDFFEYQKKKAINPIIDMEKDVYLPKSFEGQYKGSDTDFKEIEEIRINLHFRTRDLDSWKVDENGNWFIIDYYPYTSRALTNKELINSSDVMGLLNFTNGDVFYQKSKIAKSFLRLSFYDSVDQQNQMLLATSTVFMDEHRMFKRYIDNSRKGQYEFVKVASNGDGNAPKLNKISVMSEFYDKDGKKKIEIDDNHRIGSEFIIKNKYETDTSSEGYYLYMFREYSENLAPKPIYMKVEFNHAGVGLTIPFIVPMEWTGGTETEDYNKYPVSALTLESKEEGDNKRLKKGIKLEDAYAQSYIPLYAVYDFKNKDYAYVFDSRYVNVENGVATLNLFEIKYANDQIYASNYDEVIDSLQEEITYGRQPTAKINVNDEQFPLKEKSCTS